MSSGFNTDVRVGDRLFHVQTEDRGPAPPVIDSAVYQNGHILYRRSSNYQHFAESDEFDPQGVLDRVDEQHRALIEDLEAGDLDAEIASAAEKVGEIRGIQVLLLNSQSWLSAGRVSLDVEILSRPDGQPQLGAQVEAGIQGSLDSQRHSAFTDSKGRARIEFPLPHLGKGDLALVIAASTAFGSDELRFPMRRANQKASA
jgi:hypothetical protein